MTTPYSKANAQRVLVVIRPSSYGHMNATRHIMKFCNCRPVTPAKLQIAFANPLLNSLNVYDGQCVSNAAIERSWL